MNKQDFIKKLNDKLSDLPKKEVEDQINFYIEMIDDRIEDGMDEKEAIKDIGGVDEVYRQIVDAIPLRTIAKAKLRKKRRKARKTWATILLIIGFPIWGSILISLLAVWAAVYVCLWVLAICVWLIFVSLIIGSQIGFIASLVSLIAGNTTNAAYIFGASLVAAGLTIIFFYLGKLSFKGMGKLTKLTIKGLKNMLIGRKD